MRTDQSPFRIYDASAGSGKTFTLAREYLKLLLRPGARQGFRQILAITFTNKAVAELKTRILSNLMEFSRVEDPAGAPPLFHAVLKDLQTDALTLRERSRAVLGELLHNYAFFDISTIDKFNHRILRTFAQDLKLPQNFEVVLDTDVLLRQAVDALVEKAGSRQELTEVLIDFALEKASEDRSWDISWDLMEMGKSLFDENQQPYLSALSDLRIDAFSRLKERLHRERLQVEQALSGTAAEVQELLEENTVEAKDFTRGSFPKFIQSVAAGDFEQDFEAAWKQRFGEEPPYPKRVPEAKKQVMDRLLPRLQVSFNDIRQGIFRRKFLLNAYQQIAPFALLGLLQQELDTLRTEGGYLPISAFNAIIARELKDQPVPYIYERLGERYRHYFIDEFQDTSEMQWNNLVPLISNALQGMDEEGNQGSLVLVGDAKQAIYRWRGGKAEQFLRLIDGSANPFALGATQEALPRNYRSHRPLIEFNNDFFSHLGGHMKQEAYAALFRKGTRQEHHHDLPGLVRIDFIPREAEDPQAEYLASTLGIVRELTSRGYTHADICILTRLTRDGVLLSDYLMEAGIPVISSETLLLKKHPEVAFLIHLLNHLAHPEDKNHILGMLLFLGRGEADLHGWVTRHLEACGQLLREGYGFDPETARLKPVYDLLETAIRQFGLGQQQDAYLMSLMDVVLDLSRSRESSIEAFLEYWETKQDQLSVQAPEGFDAVTLMTIHKAKGLEFPVVILPFADSPIYREKNEKIWLEVDPREFAGFPCLLLALKKEVEAYPPPAPTRYREVREQQELDAFNLLYVAHTRAIKALYVISKGRSGQEPREYPKKYGDLYTRYLRDRGLWEEGRQTYSFGSLDPEHEPEVLRQKDKVSFRYSAREENALRIVTSAGRLWGTDRGEALRFGNLLHHALGQVATPADIEPALRQMVAGGLVGQRDLDPLRRLISRVVDHPSLSEYFQPGLRVFNEWDLLTKNGLILRPDRLVVRDRKAALLDYKTGDPRAEHRAQLQAYADAVEATGLTVEAAVLVYIGAHQITPEFL